MQLWLYNDITQNLVLIHKIVSITNTYSFKVFQTVGNFNLVKSYFDILTVWDLETFPVKVTE